MKKIVTILLAVAMLFCLYGCGSSSGSNGTTLTRSNASNYLNISCHAGGLSSTYKSGKYSYMTTSISCTGISGYEYDNVTITIKVTFDDGTNYADPELTIKLNIGGNGSSSKNYAICNKKTGYLTYVSGSTITSRSTYSIKSVSGSVKKS